MSPFRRFAAWAAQRRWFAAFVRYFGAPVDRVMYRATGGRLAPTARVVPVLLLTTTGRRSGRERTTPLIYVRNGANFVVSSEDMGDETYRAAWPLNLDADPVAKVQVGQEIVPCTARRLGDTELGPYWTRLVEAWPGHETYLARSGRRHTFLLEPSQVGALGASP